MKLVNKELLTIESFFSSVNLMPSALFSKRSPPWEGLYLLRDFFTSYSAYKIEISMPSFVYIKNPKQVSIGEGTIIEPGVYIEGPCIIGKNCQIRHGAYLRSYVLLGDNSVVGHACEIKHSIFFPHAKAAHFAYVGDSVLGCNVNLGAGVRLANFRIDKRAIVVHYNNTKIPTNLTKMGSVIGDNTQIGCNAVLNPGTLMEKNCLCYPNINVGGFIRENSIIKSSKNVIVCRRKT